MKLILEAIKSLFRKIEAQRTHWVDPPVEEVVVEKAQFDFTNEPLINSLNIEIVEGKTYKVTFDDVVYECVAYIAEGPNAPSIGNGAIAGASGGNGESFFYTTFEGGSLLFAEPGSHTISVSIITPGEVHKLDEKYLPEGVSAERIDEALNVAETAQTTAEVAQSTAETAQNTAETAQNTAEEALASTPDWNQNDESAPDYVKNRTHYKKTFEYVIFDGDTAGVNMVPLDYEIPIGTTIEFYKMGVSYGEFKTSDFGGGIPGVSISKTGIAVTLYFYNDDKRVQILAYNVSGNLKIVAKDLTAFIPLDEKFIPDTIARKSDIPDWDQNDETAPDYIKNRTHYRTKIEDPLIIDEVVNLPSGAFYFSDDIYQKYINIVKPSLTYRFSLNDVVIFEGGPTYSTDGKTSFVGSIDLNNSGKSTMFVVGVSNSNPPSLVFTKNSSTSFDNVHVVLEIVDEYDYKLLDPEYLPLSLGTGERKGWSFHRNYNNEASGLASLAAGQKSIASGPQSFALGYASKASGSNSFSRGSSVSANGNASEASGIMTEANGLVQKVSGQYNIIDNTAKSSYDKGKYLEIVGNGDDINKRSNAHTLDWNGLGWFKGGLKIGGTSQDDTSAKEVATKDDKLPNPNALTFTGAVTGTYDGSAPMTVEIPEGGAGGGSKEWRLFKTLTVPATAAEGADGVAWADMENGGVLFAFDTDNDGNPFDFDDLFIKMRVGGITNGTTAMNIMVGNVPGYSASGLQISIEGIPAEKLEGYAALLLKVEAGKAVGFLTKNSGGAYFNAYMSRDALTIPHATSWTSIKATLPYKLGYGLYQGSTFEFYGR